MEATRRMTKKKHYAPKMTLLPLVAATYFMVCGGPYGLEDAIGQAGYARTLLLLMVLPIVWTLPTALMIGELASAMPEEGGYYVWVKRGMGPFWGFQEAWLSLGASVFDMALYPKLFTGYLGQMQPTWTAGWRELAWSLGVVVVCVLWNLRGANAVGHGSIWLAAVLLGAFAVLVAAGAWHGVGQPLGARDFSAPSGGSMGLAVLIVMWNLMGWDNASTIAQEVVEPQRNYIRCMLAATVLVAVSYLLPVGAVAVSGMPAGEFVTGAWVAAAQALTHWKWLTVMMVAGGTITGIAMFNALTLAYAHLPAAMAMDGLLPKVFAAKTKHGVPWVSLLACTAAWSACLGFTFDRLIELDVTIYGLSLMLEFVALIRLRVKEPQMVRPYRMPGGLGVAVALSAMPAALIAYAVWAARGDSLAIFGRSVPAIFVGAAVVLTGPMVWAVMRGVRGAMPPVENN